MDISKHSPQHSLRFVYVYFWVTSNSSISRREKQGHIVSTNTANNRLLWGYDVIRWNMSVGPVQSHIPPLPEYHHSPSGLDQYHIIGFFKSIQNLLIQKRLDKLDVFLIQNTINIYSWGIISRFAYLIPKHKLCTSWVKCGQFKHCNKRQSLPTSQ